MGLPPGFWILAAGEGLLTAGYAISFPFLAVYLSGHRGLPMAWVGAFLAGSMLFSSLAQFIGGEVSDAVGRRKVMIWSMAVRTLFIAVIAWAIYTSASLWWVFFFHPVGMFIGSFFHPAARSWVADFTPPAGRMKAYGFLRMANNAGWALGPALGGLLAEGSYSLMFFVTALVFGVCTGIVALAVTDLPGLAKGRFVSPSLAGAAHALRDRVFLRFCLFGFTMSAVMSQLVVSSSLYSKTYLGFSERQIGLLFSINGLMVVVFQYFVTRLLEGRRITGGLAAGALCYATGYLSFGFAPSFFYAAAAIVVVTFGEIAVSPGMQALGANMAPRAEKGRYLGLQGLFQQVGNSTGILIGSNAIGLLSPHYQQAPWFIIAAIAVVSSLGFLSLGRRLTAEQDGLRTVPPPPAPEQVTEPA
ncbi:MAG: MFS transporter [Elusimicrobiales bacterium]|nr:MFS transporter [Elusimicrobiales bacterium]